jgi:hypothetical protein
MVKDGPAMTITPFLSLKLRGKKDAVLLRQRARRVASLLCFDPHEQACIAAGAFVVACQALSVFRKARICFQIDHHQLQIFAQEALPAERADGQRIAGLLPEVDPKTLFRLTKALPEQTHGTEEMDLGWLVRKVEETACDSLFDEMIKQNQEVLALLHEVRLFQATVPGKEKKTQPPHAA